MAEKTDVSSAYRRLKSTNIKTKRRAKAIIQAANRAKKLKQTA
ncbi:MAG: putative metal homeostasis protein [Aerococcaceae bacterium]|nr:putative metal homeostasis protein [Aerococcaceae bacterium]